MKIQIQRLRNLTTAKLHTEMSHIYEDLAGMTGAGTLMTHMLPRVLRAVKPWLQEHVTDARFWDGKYDTTHTGEIELPTPTIAERLLMLDRYREQPDPLDGKEVIGVVT